MNVLTRAFPKTQFKLILTSAALVSFSTVLSAMIPLKTAYAEAANENLIEAKATIGDFAPKTGFADLIEQISPAVVSVEILGIPRVSSNPNFNIPPGSPFEEFFNRGPRQNNPDQQRKRKLGGGSGFIVSADGYIVTNNHVIDNGEDIIVTLANSQEYEAELIGTDEETDLAVLKIDTSEPLSFVNWGDDRQSRVGDWVIAIGHPFGLEGGASASTGIVSALGRDIQSGRYDNYIQSDAAINRGNSGGPLFNLDGEVIGVNTIIISPSGGGSVGVGFSIASNLAQSVTQQLIESGQVERGLIGVQIQPVDDAVAESIGRDDKRGALVERVVPGKPADKAGLEPGDLILEFNGQEIKEMRNLPRIVAGTKVGESVPIKIWRDGKTVTKKITVEKLEKSSFAQQSPSDDSQQKKEDEPQINEMLGAEILTVNDEVREKYKLASDVEGVLLLNVEESGLAGFNGFQSGDVIIRVGKKSTNKAGQLEDALEDAKDSGAGSIAVYYSRNGENRFRAFRFE